MTAPPTDRSDAAVERFRRGYNCAQAVLSAYAADLGLDESAALGLAVPFGGGMGRQGEVCGALTGALMALGLGLGACAPEDAAGKDRRSEISGRMIDAFREQYGSIRCRELLGTEIRTPEGRDRARGEGLFAERCPDFVRYAAWLVASHDDDASRRR